MQDIRFRIQAAQRLKHILLFRLVKAAATMQRQPEGTRWHSRAANKSQEWEAQVKDLDRQIRQLEAQLQKDEAKQ